MIDVSYTATFDANGVALIAAGGPPAHQRWDVSSVTIQTTSTSRTTATLNRSIPTPANQIDIAAGSGNANTSAVGFSIAPGESLVIRWTGGTVGAVATAVVSYTQAPA